MHFDDDQVDQPASIGNVRLQGVNSGNFSLILPTVGSRPRLCEKKVSLPSGDDKSSRFFTLTAKRR